MKTHFRLYIAWALVLISSFSAFSASAFSAASDSDDSSFSILAQDQILNSHFPGFHSAPSDLRFTNTVLEAIDVEEETESDTDEAGEDHNDLQLAQLTGNDFFAPARSVVPSKEILPEGLSSTIPTTRSLYLIFRVFRI